MKRRDVITAIFAIALAACGGDSESKTTNAEPGTSTPSVTEAPDTAAPATTQAPTPTTIDPVAERVANALELAGTYSGEWNNTTFGSVGSIDAVLAVDEATAVVTLTLDLGGNVFGGSNPDPLVAEFSLANDGPFTGTNELFGEFSIDIDDAGHMTMTAPAVPGVGDREMTIEGDFVDGAFTGTYNIVGLAEGTFQAARA